MDIQFDFTDHTVVVFGGTSGINLGVAEAFARAGARVAVASRSQDKVDAAVEGLRALGAEALGFAADVRDGDAVAAVFTEVSDAWGPIDTLISGAAGNFLAEAASLSSNGFKVVVDIDLNGTFHVLRGAYPHLADGASVISITAPQGQVPMRYQVHVGAAKAGIDQLTRILALEWGGRGIRVNAISPGPIVGTEGFNRLFPNVEKATAYVPMKRLGTKGDIASLAMFLASSGASYISGAIIPCDGGGAQESVKLGIEEAGDNLEPRTDDPAAGH